jgi:serine/threonine protein kinase
MPDVLKGADRYIKIKYKSTCSDEPTFNNAFNLAKSKLPKDFKPNQNIICDEKTKPELSNIGSGGLTYLDSGSYNDVFEFKTNNGESRVLRLTKLSATKNQLDSETVGFFIQSYLQTQCQNYICKVYDFGTYEYTPQQEKQTILTSTKYSGVYTIIEKLYKLPDNQNSPPLPLDIVNGTLTALYCINTNGYAHLDIKPDNIMLDYNRQIKLIDFGMTTYIADYNKDDSNAFIKVNTIVGTPGYIDILIFTTSRIYVKSDIYSLGVMIFEYMINFTNYYSEYNNIFENPNINSTCTMSYSFIKETIKNFDPVITTLIKNMVTNNINPRYNAKTCLTYITTYNSKLNDILFKKTNISFYTKNVNRFNNFRKSVYVRLFSKKGGLRKTFRKKSLRRKRISKKTRRNNRKK